ncbi:hypothetical protein GQ600_16930 [Phytophthora cactorum]|nr:hypothetical protein GQ600_16930 [Phytophthora cactorum]
MYQNNESSVYHYLGTFNPTANSTVMVGEAYQMVVHSRPFISLWLALLRAEELSFCLLQVTNRQDATFYFQQCGRAGEPVSGYFRCRCWRVRQHVPRTGYSNLVSHVRNQHPTSKISALCSTRETGTLVPWIRRRSLNLFGWLRWTVFEPRSNRRGAVPGRHSVVVQHVKTIMSRSCRPLWFEAGWPHNSEHYLAVFVCYELGGQPRCPLLAMAPLVQAPGQDLSAQGHVDFLRDMLQGLDDHVEEFKPISEAAVRHFIQSICFSRKNGKILMLKTKLRPVLNQATCWSSTFCIVNRYMKLLEFIQDGDDLAEYLPSPAANRTLRKLLEDLKKIESVSKELQSKSVSIADVRSYFDALIELWPEFATSSCCNVHNPHFEAGCVKVQRGESAELTRSEKAALSRFAVLEAVEQPLAADHETTGSFVEQVKKKRKTSTPTATYMLLQSVPPLQTDFVPSHERRAMGRERRQRVLLDWLLVKLLLLYC